jgi:hypothetical protein
MNNNQTVHTGINSPLNISHTLKVFTKHSFDTGCDRGYPFGLSGRQDAWHKLARHEPAAVDTARAADQCLAHGLAASLEAMLLCVISSFHHLSTFTKSLIPKVQPLVESFEKLYFLSCFTPVFTRASHWTTP